MTIYSGFTHWKLWFSIVMLNYQRVINVAFFLPLYQAWMHWMPGLWKLTGMTALLKPCLPIYCTYRPFSVINDVLRSLITVFASRPEGKASALTLTHLLRHQNWRATGMMKVMIVSRTTGMTTASQRMVCEASAMSVRLVSTQHVVWFAMSAVPALNARMRQENAPDLSAMAMPTPLS